MLKAIMLRKKMGEDEKKLAEAREKTKELQAREKELEAAIEEAKTDEEKEAVSQEVEQYEKDKKENDEAVITLEKEISDTESELAELESKQRHVDIAAETRMRGVETVETTTTRRKFFGMNNQERDAFLAREDVHTFLERVRTLYTNGVQNRAITGAELTIPSVMLELLRENIEEHSKLYKHVRVQPVPGKARQPIQGIIPEAIWTEMNGTINELSMTFNNVEVDGYKVSGYMAIDNATLNDSDSNLAEAIITALGQSIGLALDKAILYGTGKKMPTGVVTRLAQATKPETYPDTAREWKNLSSSNIVSIAAAKKGVDLFKEIVIASGNAKGKYSSSNRFWAMNDTTKTKLIAEALSFNAAGAIATGMSDIMPIVGGSIETLDFIPDNVIIGGYGDLYLLAEREGAQITQSEHVRFLEDQTVYKGLARYDGLPVIAEGFVTIGILGTVPTADMTFAEDTANKTAASSKE